MKTAKALNRAEIASETEARIEKQTTERVVRFAVQTLAKLAYHETALSAQNQLARNAAADIGHAHGFSGVTVIGWWETMQEEMDADADDADDRAAIDGND